MKIAYVTININPSIINGGVGKKIKSQVSLWESNGHSVGLFVLTPDVVSLDNAKQYVFKQSLKLPLLKFFVRELLRSVTLNRMISEIQKYQPEIIYLRFGLFTFPLQRLFKVAPVVLEVNSNDLVEYRFRGIFFYLLNRMTRSILFSNCTGWVAVSHELADLKENRYHQKPLCVISNGIELNKHETLKPTKNQHPVLTLIGSPGMSWHGVDKLIQLAAMYPDLQINIVGYSLSDVGNISVPTNVHLHGLVDIYTLDEILSRTDVACGTLALHRKEMNEASPLKVREAIAYGIPLLLGYNDTDLDHVKLETILRIPNTEQNVLQNAKRIHKFAYEMIGKRIQIESVAMYLDQKQKEIARLEFFQKILNEQVK